MPRKKKVVENPEAILEPQTVVVEEPANVSTAPLQPEASTEVASHPHYHAMLLSPTKQNYPDEHKEIYRHRYGENLNYVYWGHCYGDTHTHGNHPFRDGEYIRTSFVVKEEVVDGVRYIHTLNSVYKVIE